MVKLFWSADLPDQPLLEQPGVEHGGQGRSDRALHGTVLGEEPQQARALDGTVLGDLPQQARALHGHVLGEVSQQAHALHGTVLGDLPQRGRALHSGGSSGMGLQRHDFGGDLPGRAQGHGSM